MKKTKLILAVILFAALLFVTIILPMLLKKEKPSQTSVALADTESRVKTDAPTPALKITYQDFESLEQFLAKSEIQKLKELFPCYLQSRSVTEDPPEISFLKEETTYPSEKETRLLFSLSETETVPVYYDHLGHFLFGEEKQCFSEDTSSYEKETLEKKDPITSEEIERLPEGGYADTAHVSSEKQEQEVK